MPKKAARIWLKIVSVRAEYLIDISDEDAIAEGIEPFEMWPFGTAWGNYGQHDPTYFVNPKDSFISLWESIYGVASFPRQRYSSPKVWRIEFEKVNRPDIKN